MKREMGMILRLGTRVWLLDADTRFESNGGTVFAHPLQRSSGEPDEMNAR